MVRILIKADIKITVPLRSHVLLFILRIPPCVRLCIWDELGAELLAYYKLIHPNKKILKLFNSTSSDTNLLKVTPTAAKLALEYVRQPLSHDFPISLLRHYLINTLTKTLRLLDLLTLIWQEKQDFSYSLYKNFIKFHKKKEKIFVGTLRNADVILLCNHNHGVNERLLCRDTYHIRRFL